MRLGSFRSSLSILRRRGLVELRLEPEQDEAMINESNDGMHAQDVAELGGLGFREKVVICGGMQMRQLVAAVLSTFVLICGGLSDVLATNESRNFVKGTLTPKSTNHAESIFPLRQKRRLSPAWSSSSLLSRPFQSLGLLHCFLSDLSFPLCFRGAR